MHICLDFIPQMLATNELDTQVGLTHWVLMYFIEKHVFTLLNFWVTRECKKISRCSFLNDIPKVVAMLTHVPSIVERNHGLGYSIQCNDYGWFDRLSVSAR